MSNVFECAGRKIETREYCAVLTGVVILLINTLA